jgi:hypothetical protein
MDPYVEGPGLWATVHSSMIGEIARQLAPKLRPKYVQMTQQRFVTDWGEADEGISIAKTDLYPDVAVATVGRRSTRAPQREQTIAPVRVLTAMPSRLPQSSIEIRDVKGRNLVAAIELLSPVNKRGRSRQEYIERRNKMLASTAHLIEIDLSWASKRLKASSRRK